MRRDMSEALMRSVLGGNSEDAMFLAEKLAEIAPKRKSDGGGPHLLLAHKWATAGERDRLKKDLAEALMRSVLAGGLVPE